MKVVYIANKNEKGGAFYSLMEMVLTLRDEHGVEPVILTQGENKLTEFCKKNGIETYAVGHDPFMLYKGSTLPRKTVKFILRPYYGVRRRKRFESAIKKAEEKIDFSKVDLIHTNVNRDDIGQELSLKYNIPHIWHIREFSDKDYDCAFLRKNSIEYMNGINGYFVAISDAVKNVWVNKGLDSGRIKRIYNGIDLKRFDRNIQHDFSGEDLHFIFTGTICSTKGQAQAIKAISMLPEEVGRHIYADFYGSGVKGYVKTLEKLADIGGISERIRFCGYSNEIEKVLPQYQCAFVCSDAEAFGRVTVEHMYSGLAVIASDSGANPELIDDGKDGFLYKSGDIGSLRDTIIKVYNSRERLNDISQRAKKKAEECFSRSVNAANIYSLYEEVCDKYGKKEN